MNHLWAPWRATYVSEKSDPNRCIFCDAAASTDDAASLVIHRAQFSFVILNRFPYTSGHLMIAPFAHVSRLQQADEATSAEIMQLSRFAEGVLEEVYRPDGLNLGMNLGEAAGAGIQQHIHMHLLPRWNGDANFMTSVGKTRVLSEALETTYAKLKRAFVP
ncbi:MAG TPA: HIT domain-containing protein [Bryobacteraceae bacterium]